MRIDTLEAPDDGDKSLVIFEHPRDIRGTALLSFAHILEPDDQWLYLPALKRVKRISSSNKSGPFVGSEFAYEDITAQELKKYSYTWLRDEPCGEMECFDRQYLGKYWRAHGLFMVNHQTAKKTRLLYETYKFQTGLADRDFTRNSLKRSR